jgi:predicted metal-dependent phosphotriesterase family hydrolase
MDELQKIINKFFKKDGLKKVPLSKYQIQHLTFLISLKEIGFTNEEIVKMVTSNRSI